MPADALELTIEATGLARVHRDGRRTRSALDDVSLRVRPGEIVAVTGPSGSGKSTLLHLIAGFDKPDHGSVRVAGVDWEDLRGDARAQHQRRALGFVAQGASLLAPATAAENVEVPLLLAGVSAADRPARVAAALAQVDLSGDANKLPDQLSGGQQQRVAIARALVTNPAVVLADEPTASLDSASAATVAGLLVDVARAHGASVVLVTHDPSIAAHADRIVQLRSGRLVTDDERPGQGAP
jgi:ABC-type lipoprotein export system ATPase subunit